VQEPALALDPIEGRVPLDGLAHLGDGAHDERVETTTDVALPAWHRRDVGLPWGIAIPLWDLRVASGEELRLGAHRGSCALSYGGSLAVTSRALARGGVLSVGGGGAPGGRG